MRKTILITTLIATAAALPILNAQMANGQVVEPAPAVAPLDWLVPGEIAARLTAAGWTVLKLEAEPSDANYKACMVGAGGPQIEARIDPLTGAILSQEAKACIGGSGAAAGPLDVVGFGGASDDSDDGSDSSDDSDDSDDSSDSRSD